jgi:hypothetical protein
MGITFDYDVFPSYSSKNMEIVHASANRLKLNVLGVWVDTWTIQFADLIALKVQQMFRESLPFLFFVIKKFYAIEGGKVEHTILLYRDAIYAQCYFLSALIECCIYAIAGSTFLSMQALSCEVYDSILAEYYSNILTKKQLIIRKKPITWKLGFLKDCDCKIRYVVDTLAETTIRLTLMYQMKIVLQCYPCYSRQNCYINKIHNINIQGALA